MSQKVFSHATIYTGKEVIEDGYIRFDKEVIAVGKMDNFQKEQGETVINHQGELIVPGFIDVHSHGGYGMDSMDGDPDKLNEMIKKMFQEGITTYFPTTMTQSFENIENALRSIGEAAENNPVIQGIHLEGPFISPVFKGAQPEKYITAPDAELMKKWNTISGDRIRIVTYAPETSDASEFEKYCVDHNIVLSVGHTNATRKELKESRATHVTHLYNAQRGLHHREPGVTGHAFLEEKMYTEVIADGFHIDPDMIKVAYDQKGPHRIELITDSMRAKGIPEGESELGGQKVMVKDKQARLESGSLAGSVLEFQDAFKNIQKFTGCSIEEAVLMSSVNQAEEFGLDKKGGLVMGKDADMVVFNKELELQETLSFGEIVYKK